MAKAFECDFCGKLIKIPAEIKAQAFFNGKLVYVHAVVQNHDAFPWQEKGRPDMCAKCAHSITLNFKVTGGE